ncbi:MAG TPA: NUDIX hydrolase [Anaerolineales bacterium]|jgi:ADP-ribose pyrophosphatase YjhB (NUDIX family)|nr:NUDIX hydrolase [Anaerolineales bacterium]
MAEFDEIEFCPACGTRVEPQEAFGRVRPVCPKCGRVHFQDPKVAAAALVEHDRKVLLVRRVNVPQRGKWTFPAGFVDFDEDPQLAAVRECEEETGLRVRITSLVDVIFGQEHPRGASIVIVYRAEIEEGDLHARDDADAAGFFGPNEIPPLAFRATQVVLDRWRRDG